MTVMWKINYLEKKKMHKNTRLSHVQKTGMRSGYAQTGYHTVGQKKKKKNMPNPCQTQKSNQNQKAQYVS